MLVRSSHHQIKSPSANGVDALQAVFAAQTKGAKPADQQAYIELTEQLHQCLKELKENQHFQKDNQHSLTHMLLSRPKIK